MTDYARGIEQATALYKEVIQGCTLENNKLRELVKTFSMIANDAVCDYYERDKMLEQANVTARELGVEL